MISSVDLSGTAGLPVISELLTGAASLSKCSSTAADSLERAHDRWSLLSDAYAAPEEHQVHRAMDGPRDAARAARHAAVRAAEALGTFAAAVADIRRRRLELQDAVAELQEKEEPVILPGMIVAGAETPMTFAEAMLQARADQLSQDLAAAEDQCIAVLHRLAGPSTAARTRAEQ